MSGGQGADHGVTDMVPGVPARLSPLVRRVLCPNPSFMTGPGTNTYLIGTADVAVIDPGPVDDAHLDRVAEEGDGRIRWIIATHTHPDHSPGAAGLRERTGAEVVGYEAREDFDPDRTIGDGWVLSSGTDFRLRAVHTPGHAANHLCFLLDGEDVLFSGDHIMSGSTVVIGPPDGDMAEYLRSLERLQDVAMDSIFPGHGDVIDDPYGKVAEYLHHRLAREAQVGGELGKAGTATPEQLVERIYLDIADELRPIAKLSVWAHLRKLRDEGQVTTPDPDDADAPWTASPPLAPVLGTASPA